MTGNRGIKVSLRIPRAPRNHLFPLVLAIAGVDDREPGNIHTKKAYLQGDIEKDICVELAKDYLAFPYAVGLSKKAVYGLA